MKEVSAESDIAPTTLPFEKETEDVRIMIRCQVRTWMCIHYHKLALKEVKVKDKFSQSLQLPELFCPQKLESHLIFFDKKPITAMFTWRVFGNGMSR